LLRQKNRSVVSVRSTASARGTNPRSTPTGYVVSPNPTAAMLAGQSAHVLSSTNPFARLVSCRK